jgi:glycosyltransferase involved in cell wall biosynthesis
MQDPHTTSESSKPKLFGILCTYRRPAEALRFLNLLEQQTRPPDVIAVVDNGSDDSLRNAIASRPPSDIDVRYVDPGANVGPAGAYGAGYDALAESLAAGDFVVHFDDDDPPVDDAVLERLTKSLRWLRESDSRIGAIGLSGGRLNLRTGMVSRVSSVAEHEDVDHLHGGYLPVYLAEALSSVGGNDRTFFYGFEELELGRRLHLQGWRLVVDAELMRELADRYPKRSATGRAQRLAPEPEWSRFYKERNLIRILRREHRWLAVFVTVAARHVAKPALAMLRHPGGGWQRVVLGVRATVAGLSDRGGIDNRYSPPGAAER